MLHVERRSNDDDTGSDTNILAVCCLCPYTEDEVYERSKMSIIELAAQDDALYGEYNATGKITYANYGTVQARKEARQSHLLQGAHRDCYELCKNVFHTPNIRHVDRPPYHYLMSPQQQRLRIGERPDYTARQQHMLPIQTMRICRQIYEEANPILWTTNTFSFTDSGEFEMFLNNRTTAQKEMIRALRFHLLWSGWNSIRGALAAAVPRSLVGLRELNIDAFHTIAREGSSILVPDRSKWQAEVDDRFKDMCSYWRLPITKATVIVYNKWRMSALEWPHDECVRQAERIRERILENSRPARVI